MCHWFCRVVDVFICSLGQGSPSHGQRFPQPQEPSSPSLRSWSESSQAEIPERKFPSESFDAKVLKRRFQSDSSKTKRVKRKLPNESAQAKVPVRNCKFPSICFAICFVTNQHTTEVEALLTTQQKQRNRATISNALAAASGLERPFRAHAPETYTNQLETNGNLGIEAITQTHGPSTKQ